MTKPLSNSMHEKVAQEAYSTFCQKKELTFHVNRACSKHYIPKCEGLLMVDQKLREECLAKTTVKTEKTAFYFLNLEGCTRYIDQDVIDRFASLTKEAFPGFGFTQYRAVVDEKTDIELMPLDTATDGYASSIDFPVAFKVSSWVAKLTPNQY